MRLRTLSPWFFLGSLLCFLLPFYSVSCQSVTLARMSGLQLVTGAKSQDVMVFRPDQMDRPEQEGFPGMTDGPFSMNRPMPSAGPMGGGTGDKDLEPEMFAIVALAAIGLACLVGFTTIWFAAKPTLLFATIALFANMAFMIRMTIFWINGQVEKPQAGARGPAIDPASVLSVQPSVGWYLCTVCLVLGTIAVLINVRIGGGAAPARVSTSPPPPPPPGSVPPPPPV